MVATTLTGSERHSSHEKVASRLEHLIAEFTSLIEEFDAAESSYLQKKFQLAADGGEDDDMNILDGDSDAADKEFQTYKEDTESKILGIRLEIKSLDVALWSNVEEAMNETEDAKENVEKRETILDLLRYEKNHYWRLCEACRDFKSKVDDIELSSIAEFYERAPDSLRIFRQETDVTPAQVIQATHAQVAEDLAHTSMEVAAANVPAPHTLDAHKLMLNRLAWELSERLSLGKQQRRLEKQMIKLNAELVDKRKRDREAERDLVTLLAAADPLQDLFGSPETPSWDDNTANLLPPPLHALYLNAIAHQTTSGDSHFSVVVEGDVNKAKVVEEANARNAAMGEKEEDATQMTEDLPLDRHPLTVVIKMEDVQRDVIFSFLPQLGIMCACERTPDGVVGVDMLSQFDAMDTGKRSPNPANDYQLDRMGLTSVSVCTMKHGYGKPYRWTQYLGGIEYLPTNRRYLLTPDTRRLSFEKFVARLRSMN
ncbi:hypothetical protein SARC_05648 [Sphaeroforma arctica JP610]|uniref:Uncharacterized protein n=1 Tax=Sphaeroforma arctica JP610 TaxID=667725 RepID=A0A0L0FZK2_9EUKA|nr:hypothetical protein SARC_05648 [Sphaeroforma arctica JP610]KNC82054.1 hypothetical protein SARC_05648 [Sphaeroforma arctica JP610]|eukprot:XP_014155956.1 hypothetical protein SARC_05648 [Sphaeroforma arctica JP610]